ncbi:SprT-like domain-containing protein [Marinoscillum furvescens]|uniref:SprT-like family protein n=1 Tax=Marinoscillum furvescens DSM 4134 TaxID=1122208 RepID=A0A3D9L4G8_MARFU|nr:SprT-like domain-containing protein [Marinoscillum furvescens]RED97527.1 SprT-like family protein [Marinoscillum furvescens DSM 4134]
MQQYQEVFRRFVPEPAAAYCYELWTHFGFEFKIKKSRQTKLGDYRFAYKTKKHTITINNDLNPYAFLVTYLHEVAHLITFEEYGRKVAPHGKEWKANFVRVAKPVLNEKTFPKPVLVALTNYFKNPKAASCSDPVLYNVLRQFDGPSETIPLSQLQLGATFEFNNQTYQKLEKKRTRSVCLQIASGRKYLISEIASVTPVEVQSSE